MIKPFGMGCKELDIILYICSDCLQHTIGYIEKINSFFIFLNFTSALFIFFWAPLIFLCIPLIFLCILFVFINPRLIFLWAFLCAPLIFICAYLILLCAPFIFLCAPPLIFQCTLHITPLTFLCAPSIFHWPPSFITKPLKINLCMGVRLVCQP